MDNTRMLDLSWPEDLDPATVPFKVRTRTVLHRNGFFDIPNMFDSLTASDVAGWWNAGPVTITEVDPATVS